MIGRRLFVLLLLLPFTAGFSPTVHQVAFPNVRQTHGSQHAARFAAKPPSTTSTTTTTTGLNLMMNDANLSAAAGLTISSLLGFGMDKFIPNIGILMTLVSAAVLSNLNLVPPTHALYDVAWTTFLPASLALLLLSEGSSSSSPRVENSSKDTRRLVAQTIQRVALPFAIGSIGSLVGCVGSFLVCRRYPTLWLSPADAAVAGGCLSASYIGGSVNFFATARIMGNISPTLLGALAASDLLVMAIYFAILTASLQSPRLQSLFLVPPPPPHPNAHQPIEAEPIKKDSSVGQTVLAAVLVSSLSLVVVKIANKVESLLARVVPGMACAVIALLSTQLRRLGGGGRLWKRMQQVAEPLSEVCFQLLFAAIGTSANLGQALLSGPACLWFSLFGILWHIAIVFGGSLPFRKLLRFEDVLVASNAAIGGPATAAAFASKIPIVGMTLAATVWGVVGYATGTWIGVTVTKFLQRLV